MNINLYIQSLLVLVVTQTTCSFAEQFVDLDVNISVSNPLVTNKLASNYSFENYSFPMRCVFGPKRWLMSGRIALNVLGTLYCDGTNVYETHKILNKPMDQGAFEKHFGFPSGGASDYQFGTVTPGLHPLSTFPINLPWLAFCSGQYLRKPGRLIPLPGWSIKHNAGAFGFRDETVICLDDLGLPQNVEFIASKKLFRESPQNHAIIRSVRSRTEVRLALHPTFTVPEQFKGGDYQVLESTNIGGWKVPLRFTYKQYSPKPSGAAQLCSEAVGAVTNVCITNELPLSLLIRPGITYHVIDYRFRHPTRLVDDVGYAVTNGVFPPKNDPVLQMLYSKAVRSAKIDPVRKARYGIYGTFAVLLLVPLIAILLWRIADHNKRQNRSML